MNSYELSRKWFNYCFDNPEKIKPIHTALYFFAIEHCNRLGWKDKFGFPSQMVMEALGVRNWRTYSKALTDLVDFGFIEMIEISKNQYSSNIIAIVKNTKAPTKALDKALQKHSTKQGQSTVSINKQYNKEPTKQLKEDCLYNIEILKDRYKNNNKLLEAFCLGQNTDIDTILLKLDEFNIHLASEDKINRTWSDYTTHFRNWFKINIKILDNDDKKETVRSAADRIRNGENIFATPTLEIGSSDG